MVFAAVETVAKANPVRGCRRHNSDIAAKATTRESVHAASPQGSSGQNERNALRLTGFSDSRAATRIMTLPCDDTMMDGVVACFHWLEKDPRAGKSQPHDRNHRE
jgi:hypothetical protein